MSLFFGPHYGSPTSCCARFGLPHPAGVLKRKAEDPGACLWRPITIRRAWSTFLIRNPARVIQRLLLAAVYRPPRACRPSLARSIGSLRGSMFAPTGEKVQGPRMILETGCIYPALQGLLTASIIPGVPLFLTPRYRAAEYCSPSSCCALRQHGHLAAQHARRWPRPNSYPTSL